MNFPTPQSAIDYVQSKISEFYRQSPILTERLKTIGALKQQAIKTGDQNAIGKLIVAQSQARDLLTDQINLEIKLQPFADAFGIKTGLGLLPLVLIPVAIGVASLLYLHFQKIDNQRKALDMIASGMLKPDEAKRILDTGLGFGDLMGGTAGLILPWAALLIGAYLFVGFKKETV